MKTLPLRTIPFLLAATAICGLAQAERPLATDTADALPTRQCEAELNSTLASNKHTASARQADVRLSCGVLSHTEASLGLSRSRQSSRSAYGTLLSGKTAWALGEDGKPGSTSLGLRYGASWTQLPGEGGELTELRLLALASHEVTQGVVAHANLGLAHHRSGRGRSDSNSTLWSIGIERKTDLHLAADLYGDDHSKPWVSAGIGYSLGHGLSVNASLARQLQEPRGRRFMLGLKMVF